MRVDWNVLGYSRERPSVLFLGLYLSTCSCSHFPMEKFSKTNNWRLMDFIVAKIILSNVD